MTRRHARAGNVASIVAERLGIAAPAFDMNSGCRIIATDARFDSNPAAWTTVSIPSAGFLQQNGGAVHAFAVRTTTATLRDMRRDGECFVGHQANLRVLQNVRAQSGVPDTLPFSNVERHGNCGAAGAPSVVSQHWDEWTRRGCEVVVAVVGAGLSWDGLRMRFCAD